VNKRTFFNKAVAWMLITALVNPAAMAPAFARDTDIFLSTTTGSATAEPNIMIVLDTSDSMNLFEDWREYPGAYDSHVEYLWNDLTVIGNGGSPQNTENASTIASGVGPTVTSITRSGTTATVTYASNHNYSVGWTLKVFNATDPLYNGTFTIATVPSSTTLTYTMTGTPAASPAVANTSTVLYASSRNTQPSSTLGFWGGNTPEERIALWNAAKTYANGTESAGVGDPGVRSVFRNYNDASWNYFTTFTINSVRLRSPSFNRFRGHINTIGGTRAGVNFGGGSTDYRAFNKCNNSGNAPAADVAANTNATGYSTLLDPSDGVTPQGLTPSTIFAPSSAPRNSGRYLGQEWVRWERFLNLRDGRFTNGDTTYPTAFSGTNVGPHTIAGGSGVGSAGNSISLRNDHAVDPTLASAVRDSFPNVPNYGNGTNNIGSTGQPIRTRIDRDTVGTVQSGDSRSGWTLPKGDLGGAQFASMVNSAPYTSAFIPNGSATGGNYANGVLVEVLNVYGITAASATAQALAWRGNRDGSTPGGGVTYYTGTPAYYDHGGARGQVTAGSFIIDNLDSGGDNGASSFVAGNVVNIAGAGAAGANMVAQIASVTTVSSHPRITLCSAGGGACTIGSYPAPATSLANALITPNLKLNTGGGGVVCTRTCAIDADPGTGGIQTPIADVKNNDGTGTARYYAMSGATCQSTGTAGSDCSTLPAACGAPSGSGSYATDVYASCSWSGRQSLYVEGSGTYYYGGVCGNTSTCTGGAGGATTCSARTLTTTTFSTSSYQLSNHCQLSGTSNLTVNGTAMAGAVLGSATNGCGTKSNVTASCPARPGGSSNPAGCFYVNSSATGACTQPTVSAASSTTNYATFHLASADSQLVHDCISDNGTNGNPSSGYIKNNTDVPFNTSWSNTYNATAAGTTAPYSVSGSAMSGLQMNVYSVNYLNWYFGPKGPSGAPIGRKTRLQIAKDALSGIVASTNGVRFGLMVFNRTAACSASTGTISPGATTFTGPDPGFTVGQTVRVVGAAASGANLDTTISAKATNATDTTLTDFTLAASTANPTTTTAGASIINGGNTVTVTSTAGFVVGHRVRIAGGDPGNTPSGDLIANVTGVLAGPARLVLSDTANADVAAGAAVTISAFDTTMQNNPCSGAITSEGANVARIIKRMGSNSTDLPDYNNRATLITAINAVTAAARTPLTESVYEAYRYFSGRAPKWGTSTATTVGGVAVTQGRDTAAICTTAGAGTGCQAVGAYASPMLNNPNTTNPAGCQKNFVVLITDGGPEDDYSANADVRSLEWTGPLGRVAARTGLDATQADTTTNQFELTANTPYGPTDLAGTAFDGGYIWLDELTYFMANADISPGARNTPTDGGTDSIAGRQGVNTYTIGFAGANSPVLENAAVRGNGVYYTADNSAALSAAIISALAAITAWNPTVAAPTVPISALNRSENATDVYLAFFQPDPSSAWVGTVKKFQLSQYPNNGDATICGAGVGLCLIGQTSLTKAAPNPSPTYNIETVVVDTITGISQSQVDDNASSFWAPSSVTDGSRPNQGGSGYQLINNTATLTPETRKIYTFLTNSVTLQDANSGAVIDLTNSVNRVHFGNPTKISKCRLGDAAACGGTATFTDAQQETLINWLRGGDIASTTACNDGTASTCTTWRAWPHADVQHSKPAIVTYQVPPSPIIQYMYYVQNNGLLTAIDTATGIEKWSFMVEEALPQIQSMISDAAGAQIQVADGTPAIYVEDLNGNGNIEAGDKVWLYFGLRRGGRVYYAIDITVPDAPVFGWKIDANTTPAKVCLANGACTSAPQFNELGQTWSTPYIGKVRANTNPVLIFGGGYDPTDDCMPVITGPGPTGCTPAARSMGRGVFVVDAFNTNIIQSWGVGQPGPFLGSGAASMIYAIPSDITAINTDLDSTGYIDRLYVGDMWGNVWRFDTDSASVASWNAKLLATLSSDISTGERRKILFPPAVVKQNTPYRFDAVYIGTGDREHPICLTANQTTPTVMTNTCPQFAPADKMYMLVDPDYGLAATAASPIAISDLYQRLTTDLTTNTSNTILNTYKGWYRDLDNGEKVVNAPTVFSNRLRFGTYAPLGQSGGACVPPGEGRLNEIDAITGDLVPINGAVSQASDRYYSTFITHGYISTGQLIVQGKNIYHIVVSDSRLQSVLVGSMGSATKIYWYMEPEQ
jgi:type IV pilus assembly protein PilY1